MTDTIIKVKPLQWRNDRAEGMFFNYTMTIVDKVTTLVITAKDTGFQQTETFNSLTELKDAANRHNAVALFEKLSMGE